MWEFAKINKNRTEKVVYECSKNSHYILFTKKKSFKPATELAQPKRGGASFETNIRIKILGIRVLGIQVDDWHCG